MKFKCLFTALALLSAGVISAAEITAFYPLGKMGIFLTGETLDFQLKLKDNKPTAAGTITVKNSSGKVIRTIKLDLPTGKLNKISIDDPGKNGFFELEAKFGGSSAIASMVITPETEKTDPFFMSRPFHWSNPDSFAAMRRLGFGGFQFNADGYDFYKENFKPEELREDMRQSLYFKRIAKLLEESPELHYTGSICFDVYHGKHNAAPAGMKKLRDSGYYCYSKEFYDAFVIKVEELHRVSNGRVKTWLLVQEIDSGIHDPKRISFGGPVELAHHLISAKLAYNTLKRLDPDCRVILCSTSGKDYHYTKPQFLLTRFILSHLQGKFDIIGLDAYNGNYSLKNGRTQIEPPENGLRQHLLDARVLSREFGKDGTVTVEERQKYVPEAHRKVPINGALMKQVAAIESRDMIIIKSVSGIPHYTYLDYAYKTDQTLWRAVFDDEKNWLRTPFPAAMSVATTIRTMSFAKPARKPEIKLPNQVYAYLFRKDGKVLLPVWHANIEGGTIEYAIDLPGKCVMRDLDGNDSVLPAGKTVLKLTNEPVFLMIDAEASAVRKMINEGEFVNLQKVRGEVRPASDGKANVLLQNLLNTPQNIKVAGKTVPLKAAEKKVVIVPMPQTATLKAASGKESWDLPVNKDIVRIKQSGTTLSIAAPGDVYPRSAAIPERNLILYDGNDIKADMTFSWNKTALIVDAKVRERYHMNSWRGQLLWCGDSLQLGIVPAQQAWSPAMIGKTPIPFNITAALTDNGVTLFDYSKKVQLNWPCKVTRSGMYTNYHLEIPWSETGLGAPVRGKAFAMNVLFFDINRQGTKSAEYHIALTEGLAGGQNAFKFKTFILE